MPPGFNLEIQKWCTSLFHRWFYGSGKERKTVVGNATHYEYFCIKCGNKTGGITTGKLFEMTFKK